MSSLSGPSKMSDDISSEELEQILEKESIPSLPGPSSLQVHNLALASGDERNFQRIVSKDGNFNVSSKGISRQHYFEDFLTSVIEIQWRLLLFLFCLVYFGTWILFALIWWFLVYVHGDLQSSHYGNSSWTPCITELRDFTSAFLFSVETQHTTGYGYYHLTEECSSTIITFCLQSIVGCILEGVLVGILFVKIIRGKRRTATILFSKYAVITQIRNQLILMFRFADLREKSTLLEPRISVHLITKTRSAAGEVRLGNWILKKEKLKIHIGLDDEDSPEDFLLLWPTMVVHHITPLSPLYQFLTDDKELITSGQTDSHFEIVVVLEGIVEPTGQMTQARTSYIPSEIYRDCAFEPLRMTVKNASARIDYSNFHKINPISVQPPKIFNNGS